MSKISFTTPIEIYEKGMTRHVAFLPEEVIKQLDIKANTRLLISANGKEYRLAAISTGEGEFFIHLSQFLRRETGIRDSLRPFEFKIELDPNPTDIGLPEEFEVALDQDEEAQAVFNSLTPGMQRSLCHYVNSAKRIDTRIKRALELAEKLRTRTLHSMQNKD